MTAHNNMRDIATRSNMMFDELFDNGASDNSPEMDTTAEKRPSRVVSMTCDDQQMLADCSTVPAAEPVSPCTSEESRASAMSITGELTDIEDAYLIDPRVLGTGHHGTVRECIRRATGQRYAVKSIRKTDPSVKRGGLVREIMLLQEMKHDSIVQLVDVFEDEEYLHLVTDLCEGGELFDRIVAKSSADNGMACFTEKDAARVLRQVLTAVSYMHKQGVAHRDIKPENILFDSNDESSPVKIIDFGLARKHFGNFGEPPMSTVVGTPYYIAPDVLRKKYDSKCDLWSVGVIAYILLCGYPPFNGGDNEETHRSVLRGEYRFPSREWKGTSREARDFVRRLLQSDPRKRMSAEQALNHPWLRRNVETDSVMVDEERQDRPSEEQLVVVRANNGLPKRGSVLSSRMGLATRKLRMSMFGS